jgi:quinoprotein dehydrogenase-associated probable ABC transporter substrate-binding protein
MNMTMRSARPSPNTHNGRRSVASRLRSPLLAAAALVLSGVAWHARAQAPGLGASVELVDPKVFRVCADPSNMPFSDKAQQGFENKIADMFAHDLGKSVSYVWFPQVLGFARRTLNVFRCDVVMGIAQGSDIMQNTNPYYRSVYVLAYRPHTGLDGVTTLEDKRLQGKHIGIVAKTPPATLMAQDGLMDTAKPYTLALAGNEDSSAEAMMSDLKAGKIDAAVLWGPMAGYYAKAMGFPVVIIPLTHEPSYVPMAFSITMGVRNTDQAWKRQLNGLIVKDQDKINEILNSYDVPLLTYQNHIININTIGPQG